MIARLFKPVVHEVGGRLRNVRSAARAHLPQMYLALLIFLFVVLYLAPHIFITVHSGHGAVLYRRLFGGTVTDRIYGEGLHVILPWDKLYIYDIRFQNAQKTIDVLTKNGLTVTLDVLISYRPERTALGILHQNVGPNYAQKILIPEVISKLRTEIGKFTAEDLFMTKRSIVEDAFSESMPLVAEKYIIIDKLLIKSICLPPAIKKAVEVKIEQQHLAEAYEFRLEREKQEVERRKIEASGHKVYHETIEPSLTPNILRWKGIEAMRELVASPNAKVVVVGGGHDGVPLILGTDPPGQPPLYPPGPHAVRPNRE